MQSRPAVAIVGAGFSGSLLALHLLQRGPRDLRTVLIERTAGFGRGLAYATYNPRHLLNVRVGNMSAWPDRPDHLERWLAANGHAASTHPAAFITRGDYGAYLASMIQAAIAGPEGARRLLLAPDEAVGLEHRPGGLRLTLGVGRSLDLDAVVLAGGHLPPAPPRGVGLDALPADLCAPDPWAPGALDGLDPEAPVLMIGTGLTMVDVAVALEARGHIGPILALSRRGLAPRPHGAFSPIPLAPPPLPDLSLSRLVGHVRRRAAAIGWREAIDELRPVTQALWRGASLDQRRRFLRHLRPWWDTHRHRMAPEIAARLQAMRSAGRLTLAAGRILGAEPDAAADGVLVTWRPRGGGPPATARVRRIINCTGPGGDLARAADPLLRGLLASGAARADPLGFGIEIDAQSQVIGAGGAPDPRLYAVGPLTKGSLWEIMAVPDIRRQVAEVAGTILAQLEAERGARRHAG